MYTVDRLVVRGLQVQIHIHAVHSPSCRYHHKEEEVPGTRNYCFIIRAVYWIQLCIVGDDMLYH